MPGIVGLVTRRPRERAEAELLQMVESVRHESSDATGTLTDEALGVYVGWTARKSSFADGMPLRNERGDVALVFSGEEFPEPGTAGRLRSRGHTLDPDGPSYLVHRYEDEPSFPAGLNGWFHGIVTDRARGTATLFNDRYGMHRVHYHAARDAFYFASEAKAILAVRPELARVDPRALGEFIACGCVLEDRTLFAGIHVLPCAAAWVFRDGVLENRHAYFHPAEWEAQEILEPERYYAELREAFARNLPRYFAGREPVAMSLTGGLDTRMIMAWQRPRPGSLPCYTFGGAIRDSQDVVIARQIARACRQSHEVLPVDGEFLARFPEYAERTVEVAEGTVDVGGAADLYLHERAREIAPVRMTGNYGGEVLRRVRAFKPVAPMRGLYRPEVLSHVGDATDTYAKLTQAHPVSFAVFMQAPWYHQGLLALERTQVSVRAPYLDNDVVRTVFRAPPSALGSSDLSRRLIAEGNPALARIGTDRGGALLEFLFKAEYACDTGMPQWAAGIDRYLSPLRLERLFLGRHKFHHFRTWYRDALGGYVRDILLDPRARARPYLEPKTLERVVDGHLGGSRNHTAEIHALLTLELLHRRFVDGSGRR